MRHIAGAVSYHRKLRQMNMSQSRLDLIPGIGPKKKQLLLKEFGDIDSIAEAKYEDLILIPGVSESLAKNIIEFFT